MRIVLLGPPGSGKGTQGSAFASAHGIDHVSTGDMLRADTPVGRRCRSVIEAGGLVDDALALSLVEERLAAPAARRGFVLDGYPRTAPQVDDLDRLLSRSRLALDAVVELVVDIDILVARVLGRAAEARRDGRPVRADDTEEVMRGRIERYREVTEPVTRRYESDGRLARVDGMASKDAVAAALASLVRTRSAA